ncbi:hypothetical protein CPB84DRAFT_1745551 [Gymnopilus junonius]|uniref:Uncharacterized protein n=1 Tax=Gymnopilus junonius TaxID=109634 RepID=A0A9P5NSJ9_GYMJU|nr:hypothetical protein CPB84DRAFT_1745551 [Gymnopilus junonius]
MLPPPLPDNSLQVIYIPSLIAALAKLDVKVPVEDLLRAIHDEDEARCSELNDRAIQQRRTALSKFALQPPKAGISLNITTVSEFVPNPPKPPIPDPLVKEHRHRIIELTKQAFPNDNVPDPFIVTWLGLLGDVAVDNLSFISASSSAVASAPCMFENQPRTVFKNIWYLQDTGAQTSFVPTSQLDAGNQTEGNAVKEISSFIHFRPELPNSVTFIILGQHALLNHLQYRAQPVLVNSRLLQLFPQAYGQIE